MTATASRKGEPRLEAVGVAVRYGRTVAVDGARLTVGEREIVALVGPSGCGKTSLLRAVAGFETPAAGTVRIAGRTVAGDGIWVEPEARRVGMVFQQGALFPHLTVRDNVGYGLRGDPDRRRRTDAVLGQVGMTELAARHPDELSGGQQQLVALGRALAPRPELVLLDEPFASLDASLRLRLRGQVREILGRARMSAILVTHDRAEALSLADRVAVMAGGRIHQIGSPEEIYHRPSLLAVAELIGDGQWVEGSVRGGRLETKLGRLATEAPNGRGRLLVRAEDLEELPAGAAGGVPGQVVRRSFYGHDAVDDVRLADGSLLQVRVLGPAERNGSSIRLALRPKRFRFFAGASGRGYAAEIIEA